MARLALNKATLSRQVQQLKIFERFLPSLDLKRKQLLAERVKAAAALRQTEQDLAPIDSLIAEHFTMASREDVDLAGLVRVNGVTLRQENVVGVKLPVLESVDIEMLEYGLLGRPHWVDRLARLLRDTVELEIRVQVERRRLELLGVGVRKITQRVNLFEKVLIPRTRENIRRIRIYLSDTERAGVVQAKISKKKRAAEEVG
ncbi:MAG: V-type ATP synthase subunit D [Gemmatimonadota bacterium]|nr:MAG: V-type ATP synthase subunit D [Gemmatimonadota bacterium]